MSAISRLCALSQGLEKPDTSTITTSAADKALLAAYFLDAAKIAERLNTVVLEEHFGSKLHEERFPAMREHSSNIRATHVMHIDDVLGRWERVAGSSSETCEVIACRKKLTLTRIYTFTLSVEGIFDKDDAPRVTFSNIRMHHIIRHHNFGTGHDRVDPVLLARCLKIL